MATTNHDILKRIIEDLQIARYSKEPLNQYFGRVVYSALSMWIRTATLDEDIFEQNTNKIGVSKVHIINSCKPFIDNMIGMYPEIYEWFYPDRDEIKLPIAKIRDRLQDAGELVSVGFNTDIALPKYQRCNVDFNHIVIRGMDKDRLHRMSGLAQIGQLNNQCDEHQDGLFEFYGFNNKSAKDVTKEYIKNIKWGHTQKNTTEIFDKYSKEVFSKCWDKNFNLEENDISIYKNGIIDYGFIKKVDESFFIAHINKDLIEECEVRRFMYGLKSTVNNAVIATYKRYEEKGLVELKLYNKIPNQEKNILFLLGWPAKNINDELNWIFAIQFWSFIEKVLKNLNITLQEAQ